MNTIKKVIFLVLPLFFVACSSKKHSKTTTTDTTYITVNGFGESKKNGRHQLFKEEYLILDSLQSTYQMFLEINSHRYQVYSLKSYRTDSKGQWTKILQLINRLSGLREISLYSDEITSVDFENHPKLRLLNIHSKNLPDTLVLPSEAKNLKNLILHSTNTKHIVFPENHYKIERMEISNSQMQYVDSSWAKLKKLEWLWLYNNQLQTFDIQLPKLELLYLFENPIKDTNLVKRNYPNTNITFGRSADL